MPESPQKLIALGVALSVLPIPFVCARFLARHKTKLPVSRDDWLIVFALLATIALGILSIISAAAGGEGGHTQIGPDGQPVNVPIQEQTLYGQTLAQPLSYGPTKLSVLFFYRRLFKGTIFNFISWLMIVLVLMWTVGFFFANLLACIPVNPSISEIAAQAMGYKCLQVAEMYLIEPILDMSLDFFILFIPLPIIARLQMKASRKVQICGIFMVGLLTCAASATKMVETWAAAYQQAAGDQDTANYEAQLYYWSLIEGSVGIIAACLPTLLPLVERPHPSKLVQSVQGLLRKISRTLHGKDHDTFSLQSTVQGGTEIGHYSRKERSQCWSENGNGILVSREFKVDDEKIAL